MLIITRRIGQAIRIELGPDIDPATPIGQVFAEGVIEVIVAQVRGAQVRLGISAPLSLVVLREELKLTAS